MSTILGMRKARGQAVAEGEIQDLASGTDRFARDRFETQMLGNIGMAVQVCHTHLRSHLGAAIAIVSDGDMLSIDGRIDNHHELCDELSLPFANVSDSEIALAAFRKWGEDCFSRLIGDWSISIWSRVAQTLYLARDHAGTRTLYYWENADTIIWSTHLDTFASSAFCYALDAEYAKRYLASRPVRTLTPYQGVLAVLPGHFLAVSMHSKRSVAHWDWMRSEKIKYRSDREYEEHFVEQFCVSVRRRDEPTIPTVAQLSGGMDSSACVCISDYCRRTRRDVPGLIETVSYYDRSEPNWNEEEYFRAVEKQRGHCGIHIDAELISKTYEVPPRSAGAYFLPGNDSSSVVREQLIDTALTHQGFRAILSGMGGDELLGGVPTSLPELCDLLAEGDVNKCLFRAYSWCVVERYPLAYRLFDAFREFKRLSAGRATAEGVIAPWLDAGFVKDDILEDDRFLLGDATHDIAPSALLNGLAWWSVMESLPHAYPSANSRLEYRYPYLDKQLVEFLFSVPREQLVRPGRRRSLMRRALSGIVPEKVLERRRKAYMHQGILRNLQRHRVQIECLLNSSVVGQMGLLDMQKLRYHSDSILNGTDLRYYSAFSRFLSLELWFQANGSSENNVMPLPARDLLSERANEIRTTMIAV